MADQDIISISARLDPDTRKLDAALRKIEQRGIRLRTSGATKGLSLGRFTGEADDFASALRTAEQRVVAFGATAGVLITVSNALGAIVKNAIGVEKALVDINSVFNASQANLKKFSDGLFDIAKNTGQSFDTVANAAQEFARQGKGLEETLKRTRDALILTRLSGLDAVKSVETLTATVNAFQNELLTTTEVVNKLANVDAKFAVSSADLAEGLSRVGSSAQDVGVSFDQLLALITAVQERTARGGAVIGNSFKTIFTRLQRNDTLEQLEALGVGVRDLQGNIAPAVQILGDLAAKYDQLGDAQKASIAETVGGVFQINILRATLKDLASNQSSYTRALRESLTTTDEALRRNELLNKSFAALANESLANFTKVSAAIGQLTLGPSIQKLFESFNNIVENFDGDTIGNKIGTSILAGIGNALSGPGLVIGGVIGIKLFKEFGTFVARSLQGILGIGQASERIRQNQAAISVLIQQDVQLQDKVNRGLITTDQLQKSILGTLQSQFIAEQKLVAASARLAQNLAQVGVSLSVAPSGRPSISSGFGKGNASGYVPSTAALQEKMGALAAGYAPGQVKSINIPGVGKSYYNTAETVKQFSGFSQPAILPPQNTKAGQKYKTNFSGRFGFDPYTPNFAFDPNLLKEVVEKQGIFQKTLDINLRNKKQIEAALMLSKRTGVPARELLLDPKFQDTFRKFVPNFARNGQGFLFGTPPLDFPGTKIDPFTPKEKIDKELGKLYQRLLEINKEQQAIVIKKQLEDLDKKIGLRKALASRVKGRGPVKFPFSSPSIGSFNPKRASENRGGVREILAAFFGSAIIGGSALAALGASENNFSGGFPHFAGLGNAINREVGAGVPPSLVRVGQDNRLISSTNPGGVGVYNVRDEPHGIKQGVNRAFAEGLNPKTYGTPNFAPLSADQLRNVGSGTDLYNLLSSLSINDLRSTYKGINPGAPGTDYRKDKKFYVESLLKSFSNNPSQFSAARSNAASTLSGLQSLSAGRVSGVQSTPTPRTGVGAQPRIPAGFPGAGGFRSFPTNQPPALRVINPSALEAPPLPTGTRFTPEENALKEQERRLANRERLSRLISKRRSSEQRFEKDFLALLEGRGTIGNLRGVSTGDIQGLLRQNPSINSSGSRFQNRLGNLQNIASERRRDAISKVSFGASFLVPAVAGAAGQFLPEGRGRRTVEGLGQAASLGALATSFGAAPPVALAIGGFLSLKTILDNLNPSFEDLANKSQELASKQQEQIDAATSFGQIQGQIQDLIQGGAGQNDNRVIKLQRQAADSLGALSARNPGFANRLIGKNPEELAQVISEIQRQNSKELAKENIGVLAAKIQGKSGGAISKSFKSLLGLNPKFGTLDQAGIGIQSSKGLGFLGQLIPGLPGGLGAKLGDLVGNPFFDSGAAKSRASKLVSDSRGDLGFSARTLLDFNDPEQLTKDNEFVQTVLKATGASYEELKKSIDEQVNLEKLAIKSVQERIQTQLGIKQTLDEEARKSKAGIFATRLGGVIGGNNREIEIARKSSILGNRLDLNNDSRANLQGSLDLESAKSEAASSLSEAEVEFTKAVEEARLAFEAAKKLNEGVAEAEQNYNKVLKDAAQERSQAEALIAEDLRSASEKIRIQTDERVKAARQQDNTNFLGGINSILNPQSFKDAFKDIVKGSVLSQGRTGFGGSSLGLAQGLASGAQGFAELFPGIQNPFAERLKAPLQSVFESRLDKLLQNPAIKNDTELSNSLLEAKKRIPEAVETQIDTLRNNTNIGNNIEDIKANTDGLVPAIKTLASNLSKLDPNYRPPFGETPSVYTPPPGTTGVSNYAVSMGAIERASAREVRALVERGYSHSEAKKMIYMDRGANGVAVMNRIDEPRGYIDVQARNFADVTKTAPLAEEILGKIKFNTRFGRALGKLRGEIQSGRRLNFSNIAFGNTDLLGGNKDAILNKFVGASGNGNPLGQKLRAIFGAGIKGDLPARLPSVGTESGILKRAFGLAQSGAPQIPKSVLNSYSAMKNGPLGLAAEEVFSRIRNPSSLGRAGGNLLNAGGKALGVFGGALGAFDTVSSLRNGDYLGAAGAAGQTALSFAGPLGGALSFLAQPTANAATGLIQAVQNDGLSGILNPNGSQITEAEKRLADINARLAAVRARNAELSAQLQGTVPPPAPPVTPPTPPAAQYQTNFGDIKVDAKSEANEQAIIDKVLAQVQERMEYAMSAIPKENKKPLPPKVFGS